MAKDNCRSHKAKDDVSIKPKKKTVTQDASLASILQPSDTSSSRRSSRETSSRKQTEENMTNTRKSERLEKRKPSGTPPIKEKSERTQEHMITTPMKRYDRRKKNTSSGSKNSIEDPASSNMKSKKEKVGWSVKQCMMDASEDKGHEKQGLYVSGKKRKRAATCANKALSKRQLIRTEAGDHDDKECQDKSAQVNSSSNRDVDKELKRPEKLRQLDNIKNEYSCSKSVEDKDNDGEEGSDRTEEESTLEASKIQCSTSYSSLKNFDVEEISDHTEVEKSDVRRKFSSAEGHKASQNSRRVEGVPHHIVKEPVNDRFMDLEQVGHVGCPSRKSLDGESFESGCEAPISGKGSSSKRETSTRKTYPDTCTNNKDTSLSHSSPSSRCKGHGHGETCLACSKIQRTNHGLGKQQELDYCDTTCNTDLCDTSSSKDRTTCEAAGLIETVEKNNGVSRMGTSICIACKLGGKLRYCDSVGCKRCYHLSCLDPPVNTVPLGNWRCPFCVKHIKSSVPSVSGVTDAIWDAREVEVLDAEGLQKEKQYFVKYKGLAHIHNQWVTETQLLLEAPLLVENFSKNVSMKWIEEWTVPHQLLKKRLLLSFKPPYKSQQNTGKVLNYHYEWLVQWQGLDYEQATWESENSSVLDSPEGHNLIKEYEKHQGNAKISASSDDKIEELPVKLPTIPAGYPPGLDSVHLSYAKNLYDAWNKRPNSVVFDDQERTMRIVLFILSLKGVTLPFLLIITPDSLSQWEAMFLRIAPFNDFKVSIEDTKGQRSSRLLEVQKEGGQLAFQVLLYPVDAFLQDLNVLKAIKWEAVIVDESQSSDISAHFSHIKSLSTNKRLLVFCGPLGVSMAGYLDVLSLLDCDGSLPSCVISKTQLDDISKLKETLSKFIAYECKSSSSKFVEFWVPVQISNVQLEQYCSMLLSNAMALTSCSKSDTCGALHDILVSNRKCCDHPYIVNQFLQSVVTKDLEPAKFLEVGIKASGKLQFLDLMLPEMRKRKLRVLILFQPLSGSGKDSTSIGDILDDFVRQRFGLDSYERVDGIGTVLSKKQTALNNFNNKDMGRFIFLLEYRACLPSIKLSSVDTIVIFDSDWNPANDLRALQKIAIDSQSEQIMIFRLYTSWTLEEKILRLAEHNVTIDSKLQNLSRSTSDALLMWGAINLFNKLAEFHSASVLNMSSEECLWNKLMEEFLNLFSHKRKNNDTAELIITRVQQCGTYGKNLPLPNEIITQLPDGEQPHTFWRKLLEGRNPCWKYLSKSTPRQRKRPQYFVESPKKTIASNDDVGRKRKKTANNIEPVASKPVVEKGDSKVPSHDGSQSALGDSDLCAEICNESSFRLLLKLNISKLCEVLRLSEDVKTVVERFLEYVVENYRVNKEPSNTLQAFLISLCWVGSALLKHKLDREQSLALAKEHLNFSCEEEEANSVYLKLEPAVEMFLCHTENQKKNVVSKDPIPAAQAASTRSLNSRVSPAGPLNPQRVKVEIVETPHNQYVDDEITVIDATVSSVPVEEIPAKEHGGVPSDVVKQVDSVGMKVLAVDCNKEIAEAGTIIPDGTHNEEDRNDISPDTSDVLEDQNDFHSSNSNSPSVAASKEKVPSVQPLASPASDPSVPTNLEIQNESAQGNEVQGYPSSLAEISNPRITDAGKVNQLNSEDSSLQLREQPCFPLSTNPLVAENQSNLPPASEPVLEISSDRVDSQPSCEPLNPSQNPEPSPQVLVPNQAAAPSGPNLSNVQGSDNHNQGASWATHQSYSSDPLRAELEKLLELKDTVFKTHEETKLKIKSAYDKELAEIVAQLNVKYKAKCQDAEAAFQLKKKEVDVNLNRVVMNKILAEAFRSKCHDLTPSDPAGTQVAQSGLMQHLHQFSMQPSQEHSARVTSSSPAQSSGSQQVTKLQPPLQIVHQPAKLFSTTPSRPSSIPTRPQSTINPITPSTMPTRPPFNTVPISAASTPTRSPPNINTITTSSRPSRPPPTINTTTPSPRNPRVTGEIRAPAPHIRPFKPSTSTSPHDRASHRVISTLPQSSPAFSQASARPPLPPSLQAAPPFPATHDGHPTRNSSRSLPVASPLLAQASSQPPVALPTSLQPPSLYSSLPSEQHLPVSLPTTVSPQISLPPMPSISISQTGLYSASESGIVLPTPDILSLSALDLLMDIDKQVGFHQLNTSPSPPEFLNPAELGKEGGVSDLVCLSDDD